MSYRDFHGGPMVKNLPFSAGCVGSIPGRGTETPHVMEQLSYGALPLWSLWATTKSPHADARSDTSFMPHSTTNHGHHAAYYSSMIIYIITPSVNLLTPFINCVHLLPHLLHPQLPVFTFD